MGDGGGDVRVGFGVGAGQFRLLFHGFYGSQRRPSVASRRLRSARVGGGRQAPAASPRRRSDRGGVGHRLRRRGSAAWSGVLLDRVIVAGHGATSSSRRAMSSSDGCPIRSTMSCPRSSSRGAVPDGSGRRASPRAPASTSPPGSSAVRGRATRRAPRADRSPRRRPPRRTSRRVPRCEEVGASTRCRSFGRVGCQSVGPASGSTRARPSAMSRAARSANEGAPRACPAGPGQRATRAATGSTRVGSRRSRNGCGRRASGSGSGRSQLHLLGRLSQTCPANAITGRPGGPRRMGWRRVRRRRRGGAPRGSGVIGGRSSGHRRVLPGGVCVVVRLRAGGEGW